MGEIDEEKVVSIREIDEEERLGDHNQKITRTQNLSE